jgi:hypothetical protein
MWFDSQGNVRLEMHPPVVRDVALNADQPWENGGINLPNVVRDGNRYRMWYRSDAGDPNNDSAAFSCYAESDDGIHWTKPDLGIVEFQGSKHNNIYYPTESFQAINPSVMLDESADPSERYKMIIQFRGSERAIYGYTSPDGIAWQQVSTNPILTEGPFDSHNILVRDDERQRYIMYMRGLSTAVPGSFRGGHRAVRRSESEDFLNWTRPELVIESDDDDPPGLHFYTNACVKYGRAARAYLIFPMIYYPERINRINPSAPHSGLSDIQFMASRDGITWERRFREPFVRPGPDPRNWVDRNPIMGAGVLETAPAEISMYYSELLREGDGKGQFRRCTLRTDGFVSVEGPYKGWGEFTTPPITFPGDRLELNYSTAGGGSIFVEMQNEDGTPIDGLSLDDCNEVFGDTIGGVVSWNGDAGLSAHAGKPVRLRVRLRDASLYAFRFVG